MRKWDNDGPALERQDFSEASDHDTDVEVVDVAKVGKSMMDREAELEEEEDAEWGGEDEDEESEEEGGRDRKGSRRHVGRGDDGSEGKKTGWLASVFQSVVGKASLELADIEPSLKVLKDRLMTKNVAEEIAEKLCRSVASSLVGSKHASFTRISSTVQAAMEDALTRILTPKRSIDILRDVQAAMEDALTRILTPKRSIDILRNVQAAKEANRPYVMVFVGVNGVGKSTNLAKVAFCRSQPAAKEANRPYMVVFVGVNGVGKSTNLAKAAYWLSQPGPLHGLSCTFYSSFPFFPSRPLSSHQAAKEANRPYVVVFVGVNGVGKSTNLAKVAYWLSQHDIKVMVAACDTFRAGAVEQLRTHARRLQHDIKVMVAACDTFRAGAVKQLRTHARRLQIPLFERGYEKDPAAVAKEAIREATRTKMDAVLVDTAGRMQDNEPLMRALSKLININEPDLVGGCCRVCVALAKIFPAKVLFVGEALVGNDAVDQLTKFNQRLADLSSAPTPHAIDGILLTKFDTIDDKVGAALSMVYVSGAPIIFVGCGQTYTDLRRLNVKHIIRALLQ
ncbi:unnamed protein product [Closterium sp. Naga37s-1]|nr:unnamed protein product [Closterium sp. Naga37s-1]